jgi:hypothetical protein
MKALSVKQPWANLIASGLKTIETRKRWTSYRGLLLICSSKNPAIEPAGQAIAVCRLVDCRAMMERDEDAAHVAYEQKKYSWILRDIRKIKPFPVRGQLGIFNIDCEYEVIE